MSLEVCGVAKTMCPSEIKWFDVPTMHFLEQVASEYDVFLSKSNRNLTFWSPFRFMELGTGQIY